MDGQCVKDGRNKIDDRENPQQDVYGDRDAHEEVEQEAKSPEYSIKKIGVP